MNRALLDSDILSEIIKQQNPIVAANARAYDAVHHQFTIATISLVEVIRGYGRKRATKQLQSFLTRIATEEILPLDQPTAELAGRIIGELERVGRPIGLADPMIAATALIHDLDLVTGNTAHFQRVQQLGYPLRLVNWRT